MKDKFLVGILISDNVVRSEIMQDPLKSEDFEIQCFDNIEDFINKAKEVSLGAVVVDYRTMILPSMHKKLLSEISEIFPFMRVRKDIDGTLMGSFGGFHIKGKDILAQFLQEAVVPFQPRKLRRSERKKMMRFVRYRETTGTGAFIKSFTWDVSRDGIFVVTSEINEKITELEVIMSDKTDATPLVAEVKWRALWGKTRNQPPGYGLHIPNFIDSI